MNVYFLVSLFLGQLPYQLVTQILTISFKFSNHATQHSRNLQWD